MLKVSARGTRDPSFLGLKQNKLHKFKKLKNDIIRNFVVANLADGYCVILLSDKVGIKKD